MARNLDIGATLREITEKRAERLPDTAEFSYWNENRTELISVSSAQFSEQVKRLGAWLIKEGFRRKKIAVFGENSYAWILAFFAVTCSGNTAVLLDKNLSSEALLGMVQFSDCAAVCYSAQYAPEAESMMDKAPDIAFFRLDELQKLAEREDAVSDGALREYENTVVAPDDLAVIAFTSGTSEKSRGVMLSHRNIAFDVARSERQFEGSGNSILLLPLYHMFGLMGMLGSIIIGGTVFISQSLRHIIKDVAAVRPHFITAVPAMMPSLCQAFKAAGAELGTKIICGGAAGAAAWRHKFEELGVRILNGYGMTECSPVIAFTASEDQHDEGLMRVIDGCSVRINEPDEEGIGEVLVQGDNVMQGYYKMPEVTRETLHDNWLHTGDLGRLNHEGLLSIVGRKKNILVLSNGENVAAEPLEKKLADIKGVAECTVCVNGGALQAEIYAPNADPKEITDAVSALNRSLPAYKRIMKTVFRDSEFEKNSLGKIIRKKQID